METTERRQPAPLLDMLHEGKGICPRCIHRWHDQQDCIARVIDLTHAPADTFCWCSGDRREPPEKEYDGPEHSYDGKEF